MAWQEIVFYLIIFFTHIIQAVVGVGGTMLAMPPSILLVGADTAKVVLNLLALLMCAWIAVRHLSLINKKELLKIVVGMLIGMQAGMWIYARFPLDILMKVYGAVIILIALKNLFFQREGETYPKPVLLAILLIAGIIHGMFVSGGALLVIYMASVIEEKGEFRATISAVWTVLDGYLLVTQVLSGLYTRQNMEMAAIAIVPLILALVIGNRIHDWIPQQLFVRATYALLIVSGGIAILG